MRPPSCYTKWICTFSWGLPLAIWKWDDISQYSVATQTEDHLHEVSLLRAESGTTGTTWSCVLCVSFPATADRTPAYCIQYTYTKWRLFPWDILVAGGEWDYVILSTVRSLPNYKIEPNPTHGWCRQNLGFITDRNQVNVALTRARRGLFIVGEFAAVECEDPAWEDPPPH